MIIVQLLMHNDRKLLHFTQEGHIPFSTYPTWTPSSYNPHFHILDPPLTRDNMYYLWLSVHLSSNLPELPMFNNNVLSPVLSFHMQLFKLSSMQRKTDKKEIVATIIAQIPNCPSLLPLPFNRARFSTWAVAGVTEVTEVTGVTGVTKMTGMTEAVVTVLTT